ncbi:MAG: hypothetical protein IPJ73_02300 [Zoogloea sp.]|nr:hypothetical protein [Zoogloea sp.]
MRSATLVHFRSWHGPGTDRPAWAAHDVTTNGQQYLPGQDIKRLYPVHSASDCGQEYYPVLLEDRDGIKQIFPREIEDIPVVHEGEGDSSEASQKHGFLALHPTDGSLDFADRTEDYPESWLEYDAQNVPRLKATPARQYRAKAIKVKTGAVGTGAAGWFLPGKFRFCLNCKTVHSAQGKDSNRLASLSSEGRSSATSIFTHSILRWMDSQSGQSMPPARRKLLGFTDNRQDAALQAGHFNDFLFVSILRAGILGAVSKAGDEGLTSDRIGQAVARALGFDRAEQRDEWLLNSDLSGVQFLNAQRALREMLGYRVWVDQRRGWRYTNPNLEQLGLLSVEYEGLAEFVSDEAKFTDTHELLIDVRPETRLAVFHELFDAMRQGLAVTTDVLAAPEAEALKARSRDLLRAPWGFGREERPRTSRYLMPQAPNRRENSLGDEDLIVRAGPQSALGRTLRSASLWDDDPRAASLRQEDYNRLLAGMLRAAARAGLVVDVLTHSTAFTGWQLKPVAYCSSVAEARPDAAQWITPIFAASTPTWPMPSPAAITSSTMKLGSILPRSMLIAARFAKCASALGIRKGIAESPRLTTCGNGRKQPLPARVVLFADNGTRRRHFGAKHRLSAQRAADPRQLCPT